MRRIATPVESVSGPVGGPRVANHGPPLALLLESTGEGIYGIDREGCCTFINRAGAQMLGYTPDEVLGRNMHHLVHPRHADGRDYPEHDCPILNAYRQGLPCRVDNEVFWRADGTALDTEYSSHPLLENGEVRGAVITFVDISQRREAQLALERAARALQRTNNELEQRVAERTRALSGALEGLRELSAHLETVRERERTRIAREIHDELGSLLVALKMDVNWLARRVDEQAPLKAKCAGMGQMIDTAVQQVGRIITDLRPSILDHQGLWAALDWQAQEYFDRFEWQGRLQMVVAAGVVPPEGPRATAVFRIFQEVLSNVARHAQAKRVDVRVVVEAPPEAMLYVEVRDDGVGASAADLQAPNSYGVMGMRERAAHHGGRLRIESTPGTGTRVCLVMPLGGSAPLVAPANEALGHPSATPALGLSP